MPIEKKTGGCDKCGGKQKGKQETNKGVKQNKKGVKQEKKADK